MSSEQIVFQFQLVFVTALRRGCPSSPQDFLSMKTWWHEGSWRRQTFRTSIIKYNTLHWRLWCPWRSPWDTSCLRNITSCCPQNGCLLTRAYQTISLGHLWWPLEKLAGRKCCNTYFFQKRYHFPRQHWFLVGYNECVNPFSAGKTGRPDISLEISIVFMCQASIKVRSRTT